MEPLLARLESHDYDMLMANAKKIHVPAGNYVFVEGGQAKRIFFISRGTVRVFKEMLPDKEITVFVRGMMDCIGEIGIFSGATYSNSAQAMEDTDLYYIEKADMEVLMEQNGRLGLQFTKWVSEALEASKAKLRDYLVFGSEGAVASFFIRAKNMYGKQMPDGVLIKEQFAVQDISKHLGISRETVSRILSKWRDKGVVEKRNRYYFIKDIDFFRDLLVCETCGVQNCII
ncbi:Crp/Fnr family transcriptional regulator [Texcoconibacillus texcoconensis]|uniref:CRP/FNR family transcriptional regulator n=1 Tax=Texcoconibacillus texcoconensis TaxID=1095777 RepID=A0A840QPU2_9BACI|nr:Crp/Fnr family transcriptional regulator [Texcoconibacillus texcoconensis]MBB5173394.1 CRP/FNR family transcriptional regulator [Texcoconibacillus texcoconensis]